MTNKRSQSNVISEILLILIAVVIIFIIMAFAVPLVKNTLEESKCFDLEGAYEITDNTKYNCYDPANQQLLFQIHRNKVDGESVGFALEVSSNGESRTYTVTSDDPAQDIIMLDALSAFELPDSNEERAYRIILPSIPESIRIYPVREGGKSCSSFYEANFFRECAFVPVCTDVDEDGVSIDCGAIMQHCRCCIATMGDESRRHTGHMLRRSGMAPSPAVAS